MRERPSAAGSPDGVRIDDHPGRSERLGPEHSKLVVGRTIEKPELSHQPFGVEGPPFGVTAADPHGALEPAERLAWYSTVPSCRWCPGDPLVIGDRHLAPEGKVGVGPTSGTRSDRVG